MADILLDTVKVTIGDLAGIIIGRFPTSTGSVDAALKYVDGQEINTIARMLGGAPAWRIATSNITPIAKTVAQNYFTFARVYNETNANTLLGTYNSDVATYTPSISNTAQWEWRVADGFPAIDITSGDAGDILRVEFYLTVPDVGSRVITAAGTTFEISNALPATHNAAGFAALSYTEIAEIVDGGAGGRSFNKVDHSPLSTREILSIKGSWGQGNRTLQLGRDVNDAGQILLLAGLEVDESYAFRITFQDDSIIYFTASIDSYTDDVGAIDTIVGSTVSLVQAGETIRVDAP